MKKIELGRPVEIPGQETAIIRLFEGQKEVARQIGYGNISKGVRIAIEVARLNPEIVEEFKKSMK